MRESSAPGKVTGIREDSRLLGGGGVPGLQGRRQKEHPHGCRLCHLLGTRDEPCRPMGGVPGGGADTGAAAAKADVCLCAWKLPTLRCLLRCPQGQQRPPRRWVSLGSGGLWIRLRPGPSSLQHGHPGGLRCQPQRHAAVGSRAHWETSLTSGDLQHIRDKLGHLPESSLVYYPQRSVRTECTGVAATGTIAKAESEDPTVSHR